jgi:hypothetical protein
MEIGCNYLCIYIKYLKFNLKFILSSITIDPSIRYTIWSILLGTTISSTAQYACIQTQAQRYMCVKDTRAAQK